MNESEAEGHRPISKRRALIGALALALGGLAPLATGLVGLYGYLTKGYFMAKSGQLVGGATAWIVSSAFILAGIGMMALARRQCRRHRRA